VTDFLQRTLKDIEARRRELEPLVEEYRQLEEAAAALQGVDGKASGTGRASSASSARASRGGRRATGGRRSAATARTATPSRAGGRSRAARPAAGRRGRPRGSGKRAQQALDLVKGQPGITIPELAKAMKIQPNYLYRVLPSLEQDGKVKKKDKGWFPG
jgi:hypothetical protein